jgi:G:T-mismatch repair DNA endonuclease (very short patch repair protein)
MKIKDECYEEEMDQKMSVKLAKFWLAKIARNYRLKTEILADLVKQGARLVLSEETKVVSRAGIERRNECKPAYLGAHGDVVVLVDLGLLLRM